jgi:hypothetical protein
VPFVLNDLWSLSMPLSRIIVRYIELHEAAG